jgi:hypothetical protein
VEQAAQILGKSAAIHPSVTGSSVLAVGLAALTVGKAATAAQVAETVEVSLELAGKEYPAKDLTAGPHTREPITPVVGAVAGPRTDLTAFRLPVARAALESLGVSPAHR